MNGSPPPTRRRTAPRRPDAPPTAPPRRPPATRAVLGAILDHGPVARSTVARLTGLSPASVTGHCGNLLARGLIREAAAATGPRGLGRPHIPLEIDTARHVVAGAHIAVRHSTLSLMDLRGRIVAEDREPHRDTAPGPVLDRLAARLPALVAQHAAGRTVLALGVATGHRVDPRTGVIVDHPQLGWRNVPARDVLTAATGLPVHVDGHARALARAEQLFGEAASRNSAVLLFVGTVVDAAFATGGQVRLGPHSGAGSIAHLPVGDRGPAHGAERTADASVDDGAPAGCACGASDCLQAQVSEPALVRRAARLGLSVPDFPALLERALHGDPAARAVFVDRARRTGRAAALLLDMFDPDVLVVVEPAAGRLPECLAALRAEVARRSWAGEAAATAVVPSSFTGSALAVAGAAVALGALYADPLAAWAAPSSG